MTMMKNPPISLRAVEPMDADFMYDIENDREAWRYSDTVAPISRHMLRQYAMNYEADPFKAGQLRLIIMDAESKYPLGLADLYEISPIHKRAYVGIYIRKDYRKSGYGFNALTKLREYALESLGIMTLRAKIPATNEASRRLFTKAGYIQEACLKNWFLTPHCAEELLIFRSDSN